MSQENKNEIIQKFFELPDSETLSADKMAECLMDINLSTYNMYEDVTRLYLDEDEKGQNLIDAVFSYLTGYTVPDFAELIVSGKRNEES